MLHISPHKHQGIELGMSRSHLGLNPVSLVTPDVTFILSEIHVPHLQNGEEFWSWPKEVLNKWYIKDVVDDIIIIIITIMLLIHQIM